MKKTNPFKVTSPSKPYIVEGIDAQGNSFHHEFFEKLTKPLNKEGIAEFYEEQKQLGNPLPANSIQVYNSFNAAVKSGNNDFLNYLHKTSRNNYIKTSSVAIYSPIKGENGVAHNWKTSDEFFKQGIVYGPDGNIEDFNLRQRNFLELILGDKDLRNLKKVSHRINQTPFYFWGINDKPSEKTERGVGFSADSDGLYLGASWNLSDGGPCFRVLDLAKK